MNHRFSLGIDLGTSNSAIAITDLDDDQTEIVEVTQILGPNQIGEKPTLPSAALHPASRRISRERLSAALGEPSGRRRRSSAISRATTARWFPIAWSPRPSRGCRTRISIPGSGRCRGNRTSARKALGVRLLPPLPRAPQGRVPLRRARARREWDLSEGQIVLTVPASFDEVARNLTAEAARGRRPRQGHPARGAAGGVLRLDGASGKGVARPGRPRATSSSSATSAAAPPTSA